MASYVRAWWFGTAADSDIDVVKPAAAAAAAAAAAPSPPPPAPVADPPPITVSISTAEETQEAIIASENDHAMGGDDDIPPAFPSLYSIQRSSRRDAAAAAALMPPPALPASLAPPRGFNASNSSSSSNNTLQLPPSTTRPPPAPSKKRGKVALAPGHSPLDWAALKASGQDLRGTPGLMRVPPSQLRLHNTRDDAWSSFNGKVYNITPYLSFHPGGERELMRVAGRDGTKLFALTHAWVNVEFMLDECMVGFLVSEPS